jgi:hypothetical protein
MKITEADIRAELDRLAAEHEPDKVPWQPHEEQILRDYYGKMATKVLAKELGRSFGSVSCKAQRLGLQG